MVLLKNILVPTDFSETSNEALQCGHTLATVYGGSLHVLHVIVEPFVHGQSSEGKETTLPDLQERVQRAIQIQWDRILPSPDERGSGSLAVVRAARTGNPFVEIIAYARENDIDLIVMGSHGHGPVAHLLLGSVTEKTVRGAPCPVLTVRRPGHPFVPPDAGKEGSSSSKGP